MFVAICAHRKVNNDSRLKIIVHGNHNIIQFCFFPHFNLYFFNCSTSFSIFSSVLLKISKHTSNPSNYSLVVSSFNSLSFLAKFRPLNTAFKYFMNPGSCFKCKQPWTRGAPLLWYSILNNNHYISRTFAIKTYLNRSCTHALKYAWTKWVFDSKTFHFQLASCCTESKTGGSVLEPLLSRFNKCIRSGKWLSSIEIVKHIVHIPLC